MAEILKGAAVTAAMNENMRLEVASLRDRGVTPTLAILRVGGKEDDIAYEKSAMKRCAAAGVEVKNVLLPENVSQKRLLTAVLELNDDAAVHGVLIFRPLPPHIDDAAIRRALFPKKDVDGITDGSLAGVFAGNGEGFAPCTAQACMELLNHYKVELRGKRVTVVGRSLVVGKPLAMLLLARHATVTICHTRTVDLPGTCKNAEILIAAAGKAGMVDSSLLSPGQVVIDVGINWDEEAGKLVGDVKTDEAVGIVAAVTPVPGGIGTVTTSVLVSHVVEAAKRESAGVKP